MITWLNRSVLVALMFALSSVTAALDVKPGGNASAAKYKAGGSVEITGTPKMKYLVESDLDKASSNVAAGKDGVFSVGTVSKEGVFCVRVKDEPGLETKAWLVFVSKPKLAEGDFVLGWHDLKEPAKPDEKKVKVQDGALKKIWDALKSDAAIRKVVWKKASEAYLTESVISALTAVGTCSAAVFLPGFGAHCIVGVAKEVVGFLKCVVQTTADELSNSKKLSKDEMTEVKALLTGIGVINDVAGLLALGSLGKAGLGDAVEALGGMILEAVDLIFTEQIHGATVAVGYVKDLTGKYELVLKVLKTAK